MKTPDEIKKGLECCISPGLDVCDECPYQGEPCNELENLKDFLAYIQQLERERDAAVETLVKIANDTGSCVGCVHYTQPGYKCYLWEANENCYEWRGMEVE